MEEKKCYLTLYIKQLKRNGRGEGWEGEGGYERTFFALFKIAYKYDNMSGK